MTDWNANNILKANHRYLLTDIGRVACNLYPDGWEVAKDGKVLMAGVDWTQVAYFLNSHHAEVES